MISKIVAIFCIGCVTVFTFVFLSAWALIIFGCLGIYAGLRWLVRKFGE